MITADVKVNKQYMCDGLRVLVEEIDQEAGAAYVFDYENYNGGWVATTDLTEIESE